MVSNSLALVQPDEYQMLDRMAHALHASGFLPQSIRTPQQAIAIILAGRELGVQPWQALSTINVIQGKPTISPQLMLALIQRSGQLEDIEIISQPTSCTVTMKRRGQIPHTETFTLTDAQAMGLAGKDNYKKQPATMLKWRAVAACARVVFPDVILGLYTPDEMGADVTVTDDGHMEITAPVAETPLRTEEQRARLAPGTQGPLARDEAVDEGEIEVEEVEPEADDGDDFPRYDFSKLVIQKRGGAGGYLYVLKCDGGVNVTSFTADPFRAAGYTEDEIGVWKDFGVAEFPRPLTVEARLVKNSKGNEVWEIRRVLVAHLENV